MAIAPSAPEHTLPDRGGSACPPDVSISTTNEPESADVMKKLATTTTVSTELARCQGNCSSKAYTDVERSSVTARPMPQRLCAIQSAKPRKNATESR